MHVIVIAYYLWYEYNMNLQLGHQKLKIPWIFFCSVAKRKKNFRCKFFYLTWRLHCLQYKSTKPNHLCIIEAILYLQKLVKTCRDSNINNGFVFNFFLFFFFFQRRKTYKFIYSLKFVFVDKNKRHPPRHPPISIDRICYVFEFLVKL